MNLQDVESAVSSQLDDQAELGIQITRNNEVPEEGPTNKGVWFQIPEATAVFADLKASTELSASARPKTAAYAYTYFIRAMAVVLNKFDVKYIDIQGDAIFGLFGGPSSTFTAAACAITMKTVVERDVSVRFGTDTSTDWKLTAGIGIDQGTLLVRRLGLRGTKQNEVWAGKPVNMAAKLSSLATSDQLVVSDRVFTQYERGSKLRQRALFWSCGCDNGVQGAGLDEASGDTPWLWQREPAPPSLGLDFERIHRLCTKWCEFHGPEFCEAIVTGKRPKS